MSRRQCALLFADAFNCCNRQLNVRNIPNVRIYEAASFNLYWAPQQSAEVRRSTAAYSTDASSAVVTEDSRLADDLRTRRRQYAEEVSRMRKKFAQEALDKAEARATVLREARDQQRMKTASRAEERREESIVRQQLAEASKIQMLALKAEERKARAERRRGREALILAKRQKEKDSIHAGSVDWIEEADLEKSIMKALADPYHL